MPEGASLRRSAAGSPEDAAGWNTYINGLQVDSNQFKEEVRQACEHVRAMKQAA
jgi:hypothetical protein